MSFKKLKNLVTEFEQCGTNWNSVARLSQREEEYVALRLGIGSKMHSTREISEKLQLSLDRLKQIELKACRKLQYSAQRERERRCRFLFYLRFIESLSKLSPGSLECIAAAFGNLFYLSVYELKLSPRTFNILGRANLYSIGDIIECEDLHNLCIKNVGVRTVEEITTAIHDFINACPHLPTSSS